MNSTTTCSYTNPLNLGNPQSNQFSSSTCITITDVATTTHIKVMTSGDIVTSTLILLVLLVNIVYFIYSSVSDRNTKQKRLDNNSLDGKKIYEL